MPITARVKIYYFLLKLRQQKLDKASLRIFIFCTPGTNGLRVTDSDPMILHPLAARASSDPPFRAHARRRCDS